MSFSIAGKTAIVTGASSGIGLAIAQHFVEAGANVVFADSDEKSLKKELGEAADVDGPARYFAGDLRQKLAMANLLSATIDAFERVDILVNGARQMLPTSPLDAEDDSVAQLLELNLMSNLRLSQMVARRMIAQGEGSEAQNLGTIINLSSIAARRTQPELLGYSISTAAVDQMTRSLAVALAPERIRVNAVAFGSVMSAALRESLKDNAVYREEIKASTPQGRIAGPREVAEAVQFLASDSAGFMTGQVMTVDGGRSLIDPANAPVH